MYEYTIYLYIYLNISRRALSVGYRLHYITSHRHSLSVRSFQSKTIPFLLNYSCIFLNSIKSFFSVATFIASRFSLSSIPACVPRFHMAASAAGSAVAAFKSIGISSGLSSERKLCRFGKFSPISGSIQLQHRTLNLQCRSSRSFASSGNHYYSTFLTFFKVSLSIQIVFMDVTHTSAAKMHVWWFVDDFYFYFLNW